MKKLFLFITAGVLMVSSAFAPMADMMYPELTQTFKSVKKSMPITYDRKDELGGIQQLAIVAKGKKQPILIEFVGSDGFTTQIAKAAFETALVNYGINDVKTAIVGSSASVNAVSSLNKLGFKATGDDAKYNDLGGFVSLKNSSSSAQAIHVLLQANSASLLSNEDKFAVKLKYQAVPANGTEELYDAQAKLITAEMIFAATRFKENWK